VTREHSKAPPAYKEEAALRGVRSDRLWPGRTVLYVREVAQALHVTEQHVINLITEGRLRAVNIANGLKKTRREHWRIPVTAWDLFIQENAS